MWQPTLHCGLVHYHSRNPAKWLDCRNGNVLNHTQGSVANLLSTSHSTLPAGTDGQGGLNGCFREYQGHKWKKRTITQMALDEHYIWQMKSLILWQMIEILCLIELLNQINL